MKTGDYVQIRDTYFTDHEDLKEFLINKEERRLYVGVIVKIDDQNACIPFRSKTPNNGRVAARGTFPIPSSTRPEACLDLTKTLIIKEESYLKILDEKTIKIPETQKKKISENIDEIQQKLDKYLEGYKKAEKSGRISRDALFKFSTLQNYHEELGITKEYEVEKEKGKDRDDPKIENVQKDQERQRRLAHMRQMGRER
ncbi:type III toxin-antitoxin system ToxN/AbiQ family toxin [Bacillus cereus]|uniref:type III toxin-antitoxin system ToxN/AbiQ family toxin n=1 Tax=Bacillus cereus TaxID=1396 RepID=UPI001155714E|nr:type III toxin-antitoxin system ToxN/AbiQ family toxin [Bacillus cereus]